jgi:hypothetical protein
MTKITHVDLPDDDPFGCLCDICNQEAIDRAFAERETLRERMRELAGLETENQRLREAIADLLPAWLNRWDPGKNQDIIDRAEALLKP